MNLKTNFAAGDGNVVKEYKKVADGRGAEC